MAHSLVKKNLWAEFGTQGSGEQCSACLISLIHARVCQLLYKYRLSVFTCRSFFMCCHIVHCGIWSSGAFLWLFLWDWIINTLTTANITACAILHLLCGWSLIVPRVRVCFFQSNNIIFHGGALLKCFWDSVITLAIAWPVCGILCTHLPPIILQWNNFVLAMVIIHYVCVAHKIH